MTKIRKALVAVLGAAAEAVTLNLLPTNVARWVGIAIAAATALGVYGVPNASGVAGPVPPVK